MAKQFIPLRSIRSCYPVPADVQASLGWEVTPQHWSVVLLPLAAEVQCFGLHPHQRELDLRSAKSCSSGCTVGRWASLRCVLWSLKAIWEEGKVNYILEKESHFGATQEVSCCGLVNTKKWWACFGSRRQQWGLCCRKLPPWNAKDFMGTNKLNLVLTLKMQQ